MNSTTRGCVVVGLALAVPLHAAQEPRTRMLSGRVVAAENSAALARVRVAIDAGGRRVAAVLTDDGGRFALDVPAATALTLTATKAGYAAATTGVPGAARSVQLQIRLPKAAAIGGRVVTGNGGPAAGSRVTARRLDAPSAGMAATEFIATTDDLGEFRVGGLAAGRYAIASGPAPVPPMAVMLPPQLIARTGDARDALERSLGGRTPPTANQPAVGATQTVDVSSGDEIRLPDFVHPLPPPPDRRAPASTGNSIIDQRERLRSLCSGDSIVQVRVLDRLGRPLGDVTTAVGMRSATAAVLSTRQTDATGTAVFDCLRPGEYRVQAAITGYSFRTDSPHGGLVTIGDQETVQVSLTLERASAIAGTVVDEHGEPLQDAIVQALQVRYSGGRMTAVQVGPERRTDDRGRFRVFGLERGAYFLSASLDASAADHDGGTGYAPLYYPGIPTLEGATPLTADGRDLTGVDIVFRRSPAVRLTGFALDGEGRPLKGGVLLAVSHRSGGIAREPITAAVGPDGIFTLPDVPRGDYVVHAVASRVIGQPAEFGSTFVTVSAASPPPITVRTTPSATLEGRLDIEGRQGEPIEPRTMSDFSLVAYPADPDGTPFPGFGDELAIRGSGGFYVSGLHGPIRIALSRAPADWYLKSVRVNGSDVTDSVFEVHGRTLEDAEIVISTIGAAVSGRVLDERERPVAGAAIVVFSVARTAWTPHSRFMRMASSASDGGYEIRGLPAGEYLIAATAGTAVTGAREDVTGFTTGGGVSPGDIVSGLTRASADAWQEPGLLGTLAARAERVTLAESEQHSITIHVSGR